MENPRKKFPSVLGSGIFLKKISTYHASAIGRMRQGKQMCLCGGNEMRRILEIAAFHLDAATKHRSPNKGAMINDIRAI